MLIIKSIEDTFERQDINPIMARIHFLLEKVYVRTFEGKVIGYIV